MREPRALRLLQRPLLSAIQYVSYQPDFRGKYRARNLLLKIATLLQSHTGPLPWRLHSGIWIELDLSVGMCRWLLTNNVDEACTERLLPRVLREGDTVVDVGANLGSFTLMCARRVGPKGLVVSLEPGSRMSAALRRNLGLNGVADWVQVHQLAVCDEEGRRTLLLTTGGENTAVLAAPQNGAAPARAGAQYGEEVTVTRLDTIVSGVSRPIRLVKIDVEGAEWNVLRGATQLLEHDRPCLLIELSARQQAAFGYTPMELVRWLETRGYSFHWVGDLERPFEEDDLKRGAFIDVFAHPQGDAAWRR